MPIPVSRGTASRDTGSDPVVVTSFAAPANTLLLAFVLEDNVSGIDSIAGHATWTQIDIYHSADNNVVNGSIWGCVTGPSGSTATVTVNKAADGAVGVLVAEVPGADISSGVAGAIVQVAQADGWSTSPSVGLTAAPTGTTMVFWPQASPNFDSLEGTLLSYYPFRFNQMHLNVIYDETGVQTRGGVLPYNVYWNGIAIELAGGSSTIDVTDINSGDPVKTGDTGISVTGSGLDTVTEITINGDVQTINAGATDTNLTFDLVQNSFAFGTFNVTFSDGSGSVIESVTVEKADNKNVTTVGSFIESDTTHRVETSPDLQAGWLIEYDNLAGLTIIDSGAIEYQGALDVITFDVRVFDGTVWSSAVEYTINRANEARISAGAQLTIAGGKNSSNSVVVSEGIQVSASGSKPSGGSVVVSEGVGLSIVGGKYLFGSVAISEGATVSVSSAPQSNDFFSFTPPNNRIINFS